MFAVYCVIAYMVVGTVLMRKVARTKNLNFFYKIVACLFLPVFVLWLCLGIVIYWTEEGWYEFFPKKKVFKVGDIWRTRDGSLVRIKDIKADHLFSTTTLGSMDIFHYPDGRCSRIKEMPYDLKENIS